MACIVPQPESNLTRRDFRAMILNLFKREKSCLEIHETLQKHFPNIVPCLRRVERWYSEFLHENFIFEDGPRPGRPSITHTVDSVELVLDEVTKDPHVT
ncbi:Histone-lysine N-methyltransferase SETMAR-like [Oopsacas minuta]|uniref:Histone-lysine N-methyltransferase SETMAR-like n=1 Tax=Oopsacas minuta TaxID=111878 RepID=A0AAV7JS82_9METZ|nr:Histone-lysine N-methyltransferase SETMAR-like [Oopsacas minuta]